MKRQNEEIDKLFSKGLNNFEETPSANAWSQIENQLPSKRTRTFYWVAASFVGVLVTAAIGWNSIVKKSETNIYDSQQLTAQASYPEKEFIAVPVILQTKTIVYVDRPVQVNQPNNSMEQPAVAVANAETTEARPALELQPFGASYALSSNMALPESMQNSSFAMASADDEAVTIIYKKGDPKYPKLAKALNFMNSMGRSAFTLVTTWNPPWNT